MVCLLKVKDGHPEGGEWVDLESIDVGSFKDQEHGDLVRDTLEALDTEGAASRPSECRGWHGEVIEWIERQLSEKGYCVDHIEQMRSSILRAHTGKEAFYFKAIIDPWYTNEPVIADTLGTCYPHLVPRPICIDVERRWMLTSAFGDTLEDPERDREMLVRAAQAYARMQVDSAAKLDNLKISDAHGFDTDRLSKTIEAYVLEWSVVKSLEPEERSRLEGHLPTIKDCIAQLVDSPIPQTIVHGDLGPYNIAERDGDPVVFDWSTTGVSFPFFDMVELEQLWKVVEPMGFLSMGLHLPFPAFPRYMLRFLEDSEAG